MRNVISEAQLFIPYHKRHHLLEDADDNLQLLLGIALDFGLDVNFDKKQKKFVIESESTPIFNILVDSGYFRLELMISGYNILFNNEKLSDSQIYEASIRNNLTNTVAKELIAYEICESDFGGKDRIQELLDCMAF